MKTSLRFEILKRDRFTCCYCGKSGGETLLEVDHVIPKAAGGQDVPENLVTACMDCNRGKGARLLEEGRSPMVSAEQVAALRERIARAREYDDLRRQEEDAMAEHLWEVWTLWADTFGGIRSKGGRLSMPNYAPGFPAEGHVRAAIRRHGIADVLEAVRITGDRHNGTEFRARLARSGVVPYFFGTIRNRAAAGGAA